MPHIEPPSTQPELLDWALSRSKFQAERLEQSREKARLREITRWAREAAEKAKGNVGVELRGAEGCGLMNALSQGKQSEVLRLISSGLSIRSAARSVGVAKNTAMQLAAVNGMSNFGSVLICLLGAVAYLTGLLVPTTILKTPSGSVLSCDTPSAPNPTISTANLVPSLPNISAIALAGSLVAGNPTFHVSTESARLWMRRLQVWVSDTFSPLSLIGSVVVLGSAIAVAVAAYQIFRRHHDR